MSERRASDEIEITPEMIEAGALVLCDMADDDSPSEFAERVFRKMLEARSILVADKI